jgi:hypothetical protein
MDRYYVPSGADAHARSLGEFELLRVFPATSRSRPARTGHNRTERQAAPGRIRAGRAADLGLFVLAVAGPGFEPG